MKTIGLLLFAMMVLGCAVNKELVPTGGSRADGIVRMSYSIMAFEKPVINMQQAIATATARCRAWGYQSAEPFGGKYKVCSDFSGTDCMVWTVTHEFQCLNSPAP